MHWRVFEVIAALPAANVGLRLVAICTASPFSALQAEGMGIHSLLLSLNGQSQRSCLDRAGTSVALEVCSMPGAVVSAVEGLRLLCGPADPLLAAALRPGTLRALFGASKAQNAVHCTDLEEDAARDLARAFA